MLWVLPDGRTLPLGIDRIMLDGHGPWGTVDISCMDDWEVQGSFENLVHGSEPREWTKRLDTEVEEEGFDGASVLSSCCYHVPNLDIEMTYGVMKEDCSVSMKRLDRALRHVRRVHGLSTIGHLKCKDSEDQKEIGPIIEDFEIVEDNFSTIAIRINLQARPTRLSNSVLYPFLIQWGMGASGHTNVHPLFALKVLVGIIAEYHDPATLQVQQKTQKMEELTKTTNKTWDLVQAYEASRASKSLRKKTSRKSL